MVGKRCFRCLEVKAISEFYQHKGMADGHLNKCKACACADERTRRVENRDRITAYDRKRAATPEGRRVRRERAARTKAEAPNKHRARHMVDNHVRRGKLKREPCEVCGAVRVDAHHDDYAKPLGVRWLCRSHHQQWHAENGEGANPA